MWWVRFRLLLLACRSFFCMSILCPCRASRHQIWRTKQVVPPTALPPSKEGLGERIRIANWVPATSAEGPFFNVGGNMRIKRQFTVDGRSAYEGIAFRNASSEIRNPDGSVVFRQTDIEVPETWSQVACDVLAQKYFRRAGVAPCLKKVEENDVPPFLWRS